MNCSDARSGGAVLARRSAEEGPWVRWPLGCDPAPGDVQAQDYLAPTGIAWPSRPELPGSGGRQEPRRSSRLLVPTGIHAPRHISAVQLNYIPERDIQRGVAYRKSREAHAGSAARRCRSGGQEAPTEGSETCSTPGMETERATPGTSLRPTVGTGSRQNAPAPRNCTPTSPPIAVPRPGRSAHPSGWGSR